MNPYEVLEIPPGASAEEIKAAYHQMAKIWHPDRFSGDAKPEAERRFRLLAEAFAMLKDSGRREPAAPEVAPVPQPAAPASAPIPLEASEERPSVSKTVAEMFQEAKATLENKAYDRGLGLIQYALRMEPERAEFHALYAKLLEVTGGDRRVLVRTLEAAVRLNPRDVDSSILLAQTFQGLGMHARASKHWGVVRTLAPNHPVFGQVAKKTEAKGAKPKVVEEAPSLGEQFSNLVAEARVALNKLLKRG